MSAYLAWTSDPLEDLDGPWTEAKTIGPGLLALSSPDDLSTVYHALKWSLPEQAALIVVPLDRTPKSRGMAPGTTAWLRHHTTGPTP